MKAEELRIGNWIKQAFGYCQVRGTAKNAIWLNDEGGPVLIDSFMLIEPIILTEEILLKCGFEKDLKEGIYYTITPTDYHIRIENSELKTKEKVFWIYFDEQPNHPMTCIFELHQLQNLYWCLCEKELICNLK